MAVWLVQFSVFLHNLVRRRASIIRFGCARERGGPQVLAVCGYRAGRCNECVPWPKPIRDGRAPD
jgi:hypothetical protein